MINIQKWIPYLRKRGQGVHFRFVAVLLRADLETKKTKGEIIKGVRDKGGRSKINAEKWEIRFPGLFFQILTLFSFVSYRNSGMDIGTFFSLR
jgi:hypothetical protein